MKDALWLIAELGLPIAGGLIMAFFIFLVMKQLMESLVKEIKIILPGGKGEVDAIAAINVAHAKVFLNLIYIEKQHILLYRNSTL